MSPSHPKKRARLGGAVDETAGDGSSSADLVNDAPLLERLAADARDVLDAHLLSRLDDGDRAMLALVSRSMRDVVFTSSVGDVKDVAAVRRELGRMPNFVGSVGRLAWAKERGCPWDARICREAAEGGHLEVLQWARANGAPWDEGTCAGAAEGGHLEVLQWARANGCPWSEGTWSSLRERWSGLLESSALEGEQKERVREWFEANVGPQHEDNVL